MTIDWQEIANDLSEGIRGLNNALTEYNQALDRAEKAAKCLEDREILQEEFYEEFNENEGYVMALEDIFSDLAKLTDFIEEKLI